MQRARRFHARRSDRDDRKALIMSDRLVEEPLSGAVLVALDGEGRVARAVAETGGAPARWNRFAFSGTATQRWPPAGPFDAATLCMPRDRASFRMALHAVAARVRPGGRICVYGANDEGIRSAGAPMEEVLPSPTTTLVKRHCRVLESRRPDVGAGGPELLSKLEQWREDVRVELPDPEGGVRNVRLSSWPGVFAHGRLDQGTAQLVRQLHNLPIRGAVLDFGCGMGILGFLVQQRVPNVRLTLLDVDELAAHAAALNVPGARVVVSDGWANLEPRARFDWIVSNPPFHRGRDEDFSAFEAMVKSGRQRLKPGGRLVLVTQRTVGIGVLLREVFDRATTLHEDAGFEVWQAW